MPLNTTSESSPHLATTEILFNRILVATDFSKPAAQALRVAMSIRQAFGAKLTLLHASIPPVFNVDSGPIPEDILTADLEADKFEMKNLVSNEPELKELSPDTVVGFGEVVDLVNTTCKTDKVDLVVVGSHGASGLERLALGSVAESILRKSACPVMIAGPQCSMVEHPFRSILLATDLSATGLRAAQYASSLSERFHGKLTLLHILHEKNSEFKSTMVDRARQQLEQLLPDDIRQYCKAEIRVTYGKPAIEIVDVAKSLAASLIVVGLKDRPLADHAAWSTLSYVIREANCPVLGVRNHL